MATHHSDFILRLDEKLCSTLVVSIRGIVWECDPLTFRFSYVSPQAERILGYPARQWIDEPDFWRSHTHPDDVAWCFAYCRAATDNDEDHEFEYRMIAADGSIVWLHDIITVVPGKDGSACLRGLMIDITERKRTELKLRSGEERFRLITQGTSDGIWDWNLETDEVYYSPRWKSILGYGEHELDDHLDTWSRLVHPADREVTLALVRDYLEGRSDRFEAEFRLKHRDGHYIPVLSRGFLSRDSAGRPKRMVGSHVDISFLKQAEEDLYLAKFCIDRAPVGIVRFSLDGTVLDANDNACRSLGYAPGDLRGVTVFDFSPLFSPEMWQRHLRQVRESGSLTFETVHQGRDGDRFPVEVTVSRLAYRGSEFLYSFERDISGRKAMETALIESEERYRRLVELSPDAIFIHAGESFLYLNPTAARLLGAEKSDDLYGRAVRDFVHPDYLAKARQRIENALSRIDNPPAEELLVRLDGTTVPVEMVCVHYNYQGTDSVMSIARDISERKRVQDDLVKAQKLESLGVLAGGIAHDFNNILTGILGNLSLIRTRFNPSGTIDARLESCEQAAMRATELTQQLLTFARGGEPLRKLVDPDKLIRESVSFMLRGTNVIGHVSVADDLWWIEADSGQIIQVLNNLLINSAQAMPAGGVVSVTATNEIVGPFDSADLASGNYLKIVVKDHGCGISPGNLPKIFDPYFTTKQQGSGLGLASVYSIVRRHGGSVAVSSSEGAGTVFTIHLPAVPGKRSGCDAAAQGSQPAGIGRILIMDDEQIIRDVATEILEITGYRVESCADGRDAVERFREAYLQKTPFDAVIMDLTVPGGMGGRQAAGLIRAIDPEAVLIVSSGYSNDPVVANFRQYGFSGTVVKPFSIDSLAGELQRLLKKGSARVTSPPPNRS